MGAVAVVGASIAFGGVGASAQTRPAVTSRPVTAWVTSQEDGTVTPIDVATNVAGTPIHVDDADGTPYFIAATPDGSAVYVTMFGDNEVRRIDTATGAVGPPILVGTDRTLNPMAIAITPNGKTAFVVDYSRDGSGEVTPIDLATGTSGTPIVPNAELTAIAIAPDGKTAYVTEETYPGYVLPINVKTLKLGHPIAVGQAPGRIAITPDGRTAYVVDLHGADPTVTPIDLATRAVGTPILRGNYNGEEIAINPAGTLAYLTGNGVTPIDLTTGTAEPVIGSQGELAGIAFTPDGTTAYAALYRNRLGRAERINVAAAKFHDGAPVGRQATGVAITPDQAPIAAFHAHVAAAGATTEFDASASQAVSSPIANYHWDFGDGTSADLTTDSASHVYAASGPYTVVLTLTDADGTSTQQLFTGQTMSRNGSRVARRSHIISIP